MKYQLQHGGTHEVHRDAADEIGEVVMPDVIRNNHYGVERDQRGEQQTVDEDDQPGFFQVLQLGMLDLAVHLGERFLTAHGQNRVSKSHEKDDPCETADPGSVQPAQRFFVDLHDSGLQRIGRQMNGRAEDGDGAPDDQDHNHHGGDDHNLQGL